MITPAIIVVAFWLGVIASIVAGALMITQGEPRDSAPIIGVLIIVLGPIVVRVYCELMILAFRTLETLRDIERNTE